MASIIPHTTRVDGTVLTAAIYNADHQHHIGNINNLNTPLVQLQADINVYETKIGWELISATVLTAAASFVATNLSAFRMLRVEGYFLPSSASGAITITTSSNNGSSYDTGASDYSWQDFTGNATFAQSVSDAADSKIEPTSGFGIAGGADGGMLISMFMTEFNKAQNMFSMLDVQVTATGSHYVYIDGGVREQAVARNAFRILPLTGTLTGFLMLEGIRG